MKLISLLKVKDIIKNSISLILFCFAISFSDAQTNPWQQTSLTPTNEIHGLTVTGNTIFAAGDAGVFSSVDYGQNWNLVLAAPINDIISVGNNLYAGGITCCWGAVYTSTNLGQTWTNITPYSFSNTWSCKLLVNGSFLYLSTYLGGSVLRCPLANLSTFSWTPFNTGLPFGPDVTAIVFDGTDFIACCYSWFGVYKSPNTIANWVGSSTGMTITPLWNLAINGSTVFAAVDGTPHIYRSTNTAASWSPINNSAFSAATAVRTILINNNDIYAGTYGDGVMYSNDNGVSWTSYNLGFKDPQGNLYCNNMKVFSLMMVGDTLFAGTSCGLWKSSGCSYPIKATPTSDLIICGSGTTQLTVTGLGTIDWYASPNSTVSLATGSVFTTPTLTTNTTYYIGNDFCSTREAITVTVSPFPNIAVNSGTICSGQNFTMFPSGANTYSFLNGGPVVAPTTNTTYSVTGTNIYGCVSLSSGTCGVVVNPSPTITVTGNNTVCSGSPINQTANGAISYTWSTGSNSNIVVLTPSVNSTYTVYGTNSIGCTAQQTVNITALPLPTIVIYGRDSVCIGSSGSYTANGALSYTWNSNQNTNVITITPSANTVYTILALDNNGCVNSETLGITVLQLPVLNVTGSSTVCLGSVVTNTVIGANTYTWNTGENSDQVSFSPTVNTTYTVTGTDLYGCMNTLSIPVTVKSATAITGFSYAPICINSASIAPDLDNGFQTGGNFESNSFSVDPASGLVITASIPIGNYVITYSVESNGCPATSNATLTINPLSSLNISSSIKITPGSSITLNVSGGTSYTWTPSTYLSCTECSDPIAFPIETTKYCVISPPNSCYDNTCVDVFVSCEGTADYTTPNAFTPNGDNNNDVFCLQGWNNCVNDFNIKVFDRWGEKVFESNKADFCWDGIYKGELLSSDVFVFVIKATKLNNEKIQKKGNISLIR